ncbi:SLAC1 anion channel family protein [Oceanobacillus halophilus]|uniref:C4-dicarboxylate ABC transporter n=1 Tax=Oceanobacillus halophilus TaxID=930130 RepID=A0A494ZUC0_9BACI|nr:SLAC1 anion channel family protein [Oceanobacillus halophilus]RKQ29694.1 C4-dicarboxylate ABC transporter [Oceanobacillus halophilus]
MNQERGIRYFPIGLFASVMGLAGVTMSLKLWENLYEIQSIISTIFLIITSILFVINAGILLYRLFRYGSDVKVDFDHPLKVNFFAAISISLLLLAALYYEIHVTLSFVVWGMGTILQLLLTLIVLKRLLGNTTFELSQFNPAWFIPIVGNIVVPLAGVNHVSQDINLIFFSIGILFSIIYMVLFVFRMYFQKPLPLKLIPTIFIILAPPGIGFVSYIKITDQMDVFAYILFGIAFYLGLLLVIQIKQFITIPFFITWWAYLFPSAAVTNATFYMYLETEKIYYYWFFHIQIAGLIILTIYLLWKTIALARTRKLCLKD